MAVGLVGPCLGSKRNSIAWDDTVLAASVAECLGGGNTVRFGR